MVKAGHTSRRTPHNRLMPPARRTSLRSRKPMLIKWSTASCSFSPSVWKGRSTCKQTQVQILAQHVVVCMKLHFFLPAHSQFPPPLQNPVIIARNPNAMSASPHSPAAALHSAFFKTGNTTWPHPAITANPISSEMHGGESFTLHQPT